MVKKREVKDMKEKCECHGHCYNHHHGTAYGLGVVGAAVYFISNSVGFWGGVLGLLKALVWPAFLVYQMLKFFGAA
ncbi:MAG TPA: hypothetical protein VHA12_04490 [Candidatus Nanoarchaeia archaeon]|nr:hypothetical protein [Candidatus Nanoarchaeia archaeon]